MDGFASLFRKSHPRSAIKLACVQLVNDALRGYGCTNKVETSHHTELTPIRQRLPEGVIDSWVSSLPKVLWQTGASSPQTTQCILDSLATHSRSSPSPDTDSLQQALVPFFFTLGNTNTNSSSSSSKKRQKDTGSSPVTLRCEAVSNLTARARGVAGCLRPIREAYAPVTAGCCGHLVPPLQPPHVTANA